MQLLLIRRRSPAPETPVSMASSPAEKIRFYFDLFRCRTDVYAV